MARHSSSTSTRHKDAVVLTVLDGRDAASSLVTIVGKGTPGTQATVESFGRDLCDAALMNAARSTVT